MRKRIPQKQESQTSLKLERAEFTNALGMEKCAVKDY